MILTGKEIAKRVADGDIIITPFNSDQVNPNSYDVTLAPDMLIYTDVLLDVKNRNATTTKLKIPAEGFLLRPGELYIASINEFTQAKGLVGVVYGKSSLGRLGIVVHQTAGFVDSGYAGQITLEITVVKPVRIYPGMKIAQVAYSEQVGEDMPYQGKYMNDLGAQVSKSYKDFK